MLNYLLDDFILSQGVERKKTGQRKTENWKSLSFRRDLS